jgi:predicted metalloprotease with PDZ domain
LNDTSDHHRTYWGGAAFWLMADVRIRERTHNRIGVQTALRAINRESGGNTADWTPEQLVKTGDAATGGTELADLYGEMGVAGSPADINGLLVRLGVGLRGGDVVFDDAAPLAAIRRAITQVPAPDGNK